jgi:hypothetical protein
MLINRSEQTCMVCLGVANHSFLFVRDTKEKEYTMKKFNISSKIKGLNLINRSELPTLRAALAKRADEALMKAWAPPMPMPMPTRIPTSKRYDWAAHAARLGESVGQMADKVMATAKAVAKKAVAKKAPAKTRSEIRKEVLAYKAKTRLERAKALFQTVQGLIELLNVGEYTSSTKEALREYVSLKKEAIASKKRAARAVLRAIKPEDMTAEYAVVWCC